MPTPAAPPRLPAAPASPARSSRNPAPSRGFARASERAPTAPLRPAARGLPRITPRRATLPLPRVAPGAAPGRALVAPPAAVRRLRRFASRTDARALPRAPRRTGPARLLSACGQASVELVVLLPVILVVLGVGYQAVLAGQAIWEVRVAARAAARANSLGADAAAAARAHLPPGLERGLRVTAQDGGDVRVSVRVPAVVPSVALGRVSATSHFRPQGG